MGQVIVLVDWKRAHAKEDDALTPLWMLPWFMWAAWMEAYFGNR